MDFTYSVLIPLIPLFAFLIIGLGGNKLKALASGLLGTTALGISFILSLYTA